MARFCAKCGSELKDGSKFCVKCGTPVQGAGPAQGGMPGQGAPVYGQQAAVKKAAPMKPLIIIAAAVVAVIIILVLLFGRKGYEKPIKYLEKGFNSGDIEMVVKAFSPEMADYVSTYGDIAEDMFPDEKVKLKVVGKEKLSKDEIEEVLSDEYGIGTTQARRAKAAYILDVEMSMEGEEPEESEIPVVKLDGKWVIPVSPF